MPTDVGQRRFLLLRGLMREQRHWGDFITELQQQFPERQVLTLDIPGNGVHFQAQSPCGVADMTDALRQQLIISNGDCALDIIALSMGGMIALDWMWRYPGEIATAVLINSSVRQFAPVPQRLRWQNWGRLLALLWQSSAQRERCILELTSNSQVSNQVLLQQWQTWQMEYPVSGYNALRQLWAAAQFTAHARPRQPLLVMTSEADRLVDYRCSLRMQQDWQAALALHLTAGHDLPLDAPEWVCQQIRTWLDSIERSGAAQYVYRLS